MNNWLRGEDESWYIVWWWTSFRNFINYRTSNLHFSRTNKLLAINRRVNSTGDFGWSDECRSHCTTVCVLHTRNQRKELERKEDSKEIFNMCDNWFLHQLRCKNWEQEIRFLNLNILIGENENDELWCNTNGCLLTKRSIELSYRLIMSLEITS